MYTMSIHEVPSFRHAQVLARMLEASGWPAFAAEAGVKDHDSANIVATISPPGLPESLIAADRLIGYSVNGDIGLATLKKDLERYSTRHPHGIPADTMKSLRDHLAAFVDSAADYIVRSEPPVPTKTPPAAPEAVESNDTVPNPLGGGWERRL